MAMTIPCTALSPSQSLTVAMISCMKGSEKALAGGRLRLRTAMPLEESFSVVTRDDACRPCVALYRFMALRRRMEDAAVVVAIILVNYELIGEKVFDQ